MTGQETRPIKRRRLLTTVLRWIGRILLVGLGVFLSIVVFLSKTKSRISPARAVMTEPGYCGVNRAHGQETARRSSVSWVLY